MTDARDTEEDAGRLAGIVTDRDLRQVLFRGPLQARLGELRTSCLAWPEIPQCAFYVAEQYAREGNLAQARRSAALALARDPDYAPAARLLRAVDAPGVLGQTPPP